MQGEKRQPIVIKNVQLKSTHHYAFRPDEWGLIIGLVMVTPDGRKPRLCYAVQYSDGYVDYRPTLDNGDSHEIRVL